MGVGGGVVFRVPMGCLERSPSGAASPYLVLVGHRRRRSVFRGQFCCAAMYWAKNPFADAAPDGNVKGRGMLSYKCTSRSIYRLSVFEPAAPAG